MEEKRNYKDLVVWQRAVDLAPKIYVLVRRFPREELYALGDQIRRAVISVAANIAEGQGRDYPKEFLRYLSIAKGSLAELHTLLIVAQRLGYLEPSTMENLEADLSGVRRPLVGLMARLRDR